MTLLPSPRQIRPNTAGSPSSQAPHLAGVILYIYCIFIHGIHYSQYHYIKLFHHFQTFLYNLTIKKLVPFFIRQFHIILHYDSFRCRQLTSGSSLLRCAAHEKRHIILCGNKILIPSRNKIIIIPSIPTVQCSPFSWKVFQRDKHPIRRTYIILHYYIILLCIIRDISR